jgi:C-terminal processing protease CtpA/Prc
MTIGRGAVLLALTLGSAIGVAAQEGTTEAETRSRELSERMRVTLEQQSRILSRMQRDLERAARSDSKVRDSIVRETSQRISELAGEISRVQLEADRVQVHAVDAQTRSQLLAQIASARAMANVTRVLAGQQRALTFSTRQFPRGYLGVTLSGEQNTELRDGKVFTVFVSPSVIESVEAGSPAAQGGLEAGDTIVAYGKLPLPGAIPLADVLTPGERLPIRIRRGGKERVLSVLVGTRQFTTMTVPALSGLDDGERSLRICTGENCAVAVAPRAPAAPSAPVWALAPTSPMRGLDKGNGWSSTDLSLAGATMTSINEDLESLTGVDEGILVLRVAPGTPAATSGLRGGDVIIRVNDEDCESVRDLQRAMQRASSKGVRRIALVVSRKQRETPITLQW